MIWLLPWPTISLNTAELYSETQLDKKWNICDVTALNWFDDFSSALCVKTAIIKIVQTYVKQVYIYESCYVEATK